MPLLQINDMDLFFVSDASDNICAPGQIQDTSPFTGFLNNFMFQLSLYIFNFLYNLRYLRAKYIGKVNFLCGED